MVSLQEASTFRKFTIFFLLVMGIGLIGCDEPAQPTQEDSSPPITDASMRGFGSPPQNSLSPGDFDIEDLGDETAVFHRAVSSASNWKEAHQNVRDLLSSSSSAPQFILEQSAAYAMFREYFTTDHWREDLTKEKIEALGFYTDLLVENRSPESDLVYAGLRKLRGHWSDRRIVTAAEATIQAAERKYGSGQSASLQSSSAAEKEPTPGLAASRERHARQVMEANRKLDGIRSGLQEKK